MATQAPAPPPTAGWAGTAAAFGAVVAVGLGLCLLGVMAAVDLVERLRVVVELPGRGGTHSDDDVGLAWHAAVVAVLCGGAGLVLLTYGVVEGHRRLTWLQRRRALPGAPWLWRLEWRDRVVAARARPPWLALLLAAWCIAGCAAVLAVADMTGASPQTVVSDGFGPLQAVLLVLAAGALLACWVAQQRLRDGRQRLHHGAALTLERWPLDKGRDTQLSLRRPPLAPELLELRTLLLCDRVLAGSRSTRRERLWEVGAVLGRLGPGQALHTRVRLPAGLPDADPDPDAATRHEWRLELQWRGLRAPLVFDLPVFTPPAAVLMAAAEPAPSVDAGSALVDLCGRTDLRVPEIEQGLAQQGITSRWDGERLRRLELPVRRLRGVLFGLGGFNLAWSGVVLLQALMGAPWFFTLGFGAFALLFWVLFVRLLRSSHVLRFDDDGVRIGKPGAVDAAPARHYSGIRVELSMRSGIRSWHDIVGDAQGRPVKLVGLVAGQHLADALAAHVAVAARRPAARRRGRGPANDPGP